MADLFKDAKRGKPLPRIIGGYTYTGERYADVETEPGVMPPMLYTISVHSGQIGGKGDECYELRLTETEMLSTCAGWMNAISSRRAQAEAKARKDAAQVRR